MNYSLRLNSFLLFIARAGGIGFSWLFTFIVARHLSVEAFGRFSYLAAVVFIGNTVTNFGTDTYLVRETAHSRQITDSLSRALTAQLTLSVLWIVAALLLHNTLLVIYSLSLLPLAFISVLMAVFRGFERMDVSLWTTLINGAVQVAAALISSDLETLIVFLVLGFLFQAVIAYWLGKRLLPGHHLLPLKGFWPLLKLLLPFAVLAIFQVLSQRLGILTVSKLLGDVSAGIFSSTARVIEGLKIGHYAILGALLPVLSRRNDGSRQSLQQAFVVLLLASILMALGLLIFPRFVILILYGVKYEAAIRLLSMLGWSLIPFTISSIIAYDLIARGFEIMLVKATALSLFMFLVLYLWLISVYQLDGAIYAALLGEAGQAIIYSITRRKLLAQSALSQEPEYQDYPQAG